MPTWRALPLSLLLCIPWLACSEPDIPPAPDGGVTEDAGSDAGTAPGDAGTDGGMGDAEVRVRRFLRHVTPGGVEEVPEDFGRNPVELFVVEGESLVSVPGRPGAPGEYVFPNVPRAPYYVKAGTDYVLTDARAVDLSVNHHFRSGIEPLDGVSEVQLRVLDVEPWFGPRDPFAPYPRLNFFSEEVGYAALPLVRLEREGQSQVAESISLPALPWFDPARGDRAWVIQLSPRVLGQNPDGSLRHYLTAVGALHLPPLSHDGIGPLRIEGRLKRLEMREVTVDWRTTEFVSAAAEAHPLATVSSTTLRLYPALAAPAGGWDSRFELLQLAGPQTGAYDVQGALAYGNPSPSQEPVVGRATVSSVLTFMPPEEAPVQLLTVTLSVTGPLSQLAAGPIRPGVLPPRDLRVDGLEASSSRTLAAGGHVVSWQPPSQGTPDAYVLSLMLLHSEQEARYFLPEARLYVDGGATSVRLPSHLMQPGQRYALALEAVRSEGYAVSDRPLTLSNRLSVSRAQTLSGLLSLPARAP